MAFWTTFAKQVLRRVFNENVGGYDSNRAKESRCMKCGRMVRAESLHQGRCIACRLDQEREREQEQGQKRNHERESGSDHTRASGDTNHDLARAYQILHCKESDSDAEIKKRYRALIKECHVDSLPKDLPDYLVKAANRRFVEVQEAYELIGQVRKMQ